MDDTNKNKKDKIEFVVHSVHMRLVKGKCTNSAFK